MNNTFKKITSIMLLVAGLSLTLVGCGTGPDSGGMGATKSTASLN